MEGSEDGASQVDAPEAPQASAGQEVNNKPESGESVEGLRKENASWRRKVRDLEAKVKEFEDARLGETERLQKQAQEAAAQAQAAREALKTARFEAALAREAAKAGVDPALLARLIDPEYDDEGQPANVGSAVAKVLESYPQLKPAPAAPPAPAPNSNPTNPPRVGKLTMDEIKRMSPDEINARWADVQEVMKTAGR